MNRLPRPSSLAWLALVVGVAGWTVFLNGQRSARLEAVGAQAPIEAVEAASPTGYARGTRGLLLPAESAASQAWIMDVQKMLATDSWQVTRTDYDNAPEGRAVHGPAAYRWWLRAVAGLFQRWHTLPAGLAVERAALWADPLLHLGLCLGAGFFAAWRWGAPAGGLLAAGCAALLAHAQVLTAGQPDSHGLFLAANLVGLLLLLAAWQSTGARAARLWLAAAGAAGGFGLWLEAGSQLVVLGVWLNAGLAAAWWQSRPRVALGPSLPWRAWAAGAAGVALVGWFLDGRPGAWAGQNLSQNHPLLALTWIGAAEILIRGPIAWRDRSNRRVWVGVALAALGLLAPPVWLLVHGGTGGADFGPNHPALSGREGLLGWLKADGLSIGLVAVLLPVLLVPAAGRLLRTKTAHGPALLFALVCSLGLIAAGTLQLRWWGLVDVMLLGLLAMVAAAAPGGLAGLGWRSGLGLMLLPALAAAWPRSAADGTLAPAEARALVERDLAQWLTQRAEPGTIAFAPPALSGSLCYYGGLRVIASPYPGNQDGLTLSGRIAGTPSADEAQALVQRRGIQYIVLPSWDDSLDRMAKLASPTPERSLVALLRQWLPPRWLRPVAYQQPVIPGLENETLAVFEVVEPQENAIALSRLAEYFTETGRLELAAAVAHSLEQAFAADAGAMIARAKVALARGDGRALARLMPELLPAISDGRAEDLPWERRANLAIVLAATKHPDLARPEVEFSLAEADADRLRSLGPVSLLRLLTLARAYRVDFTDPQLRATARRLLPAEFQSQLGN